MREEYIEKGRKYLQIGGIITAIIAILITLFVHFLSKYTLSKEDVASKSYGGLWYP